MAGIFITGTDTGIGKTLVTAAIVQRLRAAGHSALPMKPAHSGCSRRNGQLIADDIDFVLKTTGLALPPGVTDAIAPYRFADACSPHLAAERCDTTIAPRHMLACARKVEAACDVVVVEGAGGVLVPYTLRYRVIDLIKDLRFPVVLVARPTLGTINHTLLSLDALSHTGARVVAVVLNSATPIPATSAYLVEDNIRTIEQLGRVPVFGPLPHVRGLSVAARSWKAVYPKLAPLLPSARQLLEQKEKI